MNAIRDGKILYQCDADSFSDPAPLEPSKPEETMHERPSKTAFWRWYFGRRGGYSRAGRSL
jgi:hypothetical protein